MVADSEKWYHLGARLGFSRDELEKIKNNSSSQDQPALHMLYKWVKKEGSSSFHMDLSRSDTGLAIIKIMVINVPVLRYPLARALAA